jgi:hypothetical protein
LHRMKNMEPTYMRGFYEEVDSLVGRLKKRAAEKLREIEEEERQKRLGPGGLDPEEVFPTLPQALQDAFISRKMEDLQAAIRSMTPEDARYHMKRCVDCGLWVQNANAEKSDQAEEEADEEEETYEDVDDAPEAESKAAAETETVETAAPAPATAAPAAAAAAAAEAPSVPSSSVPAKPADVRKWVPPVSDVD